MSKKNPWIYVLAVLVIAGGIYVLLRNKKANAPTTEQPQTNNTSQDNIQSSDNVLSGTLEVSDNPDKGNLMLLTPKRTLYLNTGQDYSALMQKEVNVKIEGSETNFRIIDILAK